MGLGLGEFRVMTTAEFEAVCRQWNEYRDQGLKDKWTRCRLQCYYAVKPYLVQGTKPQKLFPLKWDERGIHPELSKEEKEETRAKMRELVELWKDDEE